MLTETRTADAKGRVTLPKGFAGATLIIKQVSETELRIHKARVVPEDELTFPDEAPIRLTPAERDRFLAAIDNPPEPNAALKRLLRPKTKKSKP